jgi:preprotein translocase subunit SecG
MLGIIVTIHIIACIGLIFFILIQSGKGGGLVEGLSSAESILGTKTSDFLTKATSVLAVTFFITCLALAFLSIQQNKSIVEKEVKKQSKETIDTVESTQGSKQESAVSETQETKQEVTDYAQENNAAKEESAAQKQ